MKLHTMSPCVNGEGTRVSGEAICFAFIDPETGKIEGIPLDPLQALLARPITDEAIEDFMSSEGETWNGECWTSDDADDFWIEIDEDEDDQQDDSAQTNTEDPTVRRYNTIQEPSRDDEFVYLFDRPGTLIDEPEEAPVFHTDLLPLPSEEEREKKYREEGLVWTVNGYEPEDSMMVDLLQGIADTPEEQQSLVDRAMGGEPDILGDIFGPRIKHGPESFLDPLI